MKKKRFIKLLMARGFQRNEAAAIASRVAMYGSYKELHESLHLALAFYPLRLALIRAGRAALALGRTLRNNLCDAVRGLRFGVDLANAPDQTALHHPNPRRNDAVDAFAYSVVAMSREEHAAMHAKDGNRAGAIFFDEFNKRSGNDE